MDIHVLPNRAQTDFLEIAINAPSGNPWPHMGMRQRDGGAKARMFDRLKAQGYFDSHNRITALGKLAFVTSAAKQRIDLGGRTVKRMIIYPGPINDDTCRCIRCGQIDEVSFHDMRVCRAVSDVALANALEQNRPTLQSAREIGNAMRGNSHWWANPFSESKNPDHYKAYNQGWDEMDAQLTKTAS